MNHPLIYPIRYCDRVSVRRPRRFPISVFEFDLLIYPAGVFWRRFGIFGFVGEKIFSAKLITMVSRGGVCTILTHGHTKTAHISHIFSGAEPLAPCQTGLPYTHSHTWNSISRAPNSHVKTAYPVVIFAQLTAKPPPPHPSPPKLFLPTLQPLVRTTSRHLWRSVVCFPLSL